jgi:uncharacterized membrane protein YsdA (DUF1294 family)
VKVALSGGLFLLFVAACTLTGRLSPAVFGLYTGASLLAFAVYAWDKSAARGGRWRTAESTLHLIALLGGWPGALLAQRVLRHKSSKASFQLAFRATVIVNCGVLGWLLVASGAANGIGR